MKNPAEETTVRPNQNQTMGKLNQPDPVLQLILYEKEPQLFPHQSQDDYSTKAGNRLSLFCQPFSKNCHLKTAPCQAVRRLAPPESGNFALSSPAFWLTFSLHDFDGTNDAAGETSRSRVARTRQADNGGEERLSPGGGHGSGAKRRCSQADQRARHGRRREIWPVIRHSGPAQARRQTHRWN